MAQEKFKGRGKRTWFEILLVLATTPHRQRRRSGILLFLNAMWPIT